MTQNEQNRLVEVLFYLYFTGMAEKVGSSAEFWATIQNICVLYHISYGALNKAIRQIMSKENIPEDKETYYLLSKLGLTVRPIRTISGIYWQKQKAFAEEFETNIPQVDDRIKDPVLKVAMREFIFSICEISGIFNNVDVRLLRKELCVK